MINSGHYCLLIKYSITYETTIMKNITDYFNNPELNIYNQVYKLTYLLASM